MTVETISADESPFANSGVVEVRIPPGANYDGTTTPDTPNREYCKFCKDYFIMEYHFGRSGDK